MCNDLWQELPGTVAEYSSRLEKLGVDKAEVTKELASMRARQSKSAGVSMRYLLSEEFTSLARQRTGMRDPTFNDMKSAFWLAPDPIGEHIQCPRDGKMGCALVDWIRRDERRAQTHFLSWVWGYHISQVQSALRMYRLSAHSALAAQDMFFFMCFFVNNQFRIIVEETAAGSENLETIFEENLKRSGQMVAVLDTWHQPVYLSRIWTVYEQFMASTLEIPVTIVMPESAMTSVQQQISCGKQGIQDITQSLSRVDSEHAGAWKKEDETKVKGIIEGTVGFKHVNTHVTEVMVRWIGDVVKHQFHELIQEAQHNQQSQDSRPQKDPYKITL
ncbi:unnamed protein product [Symbiodinium microadriaticum]|nr:unnamed protein product [Symbiodinium microadriaticum]